MSQLSSALLHANHTLTTIDHLVRRPGMGQTPDHTQTASPHLAKGPATSPPRRQDLNSELRPQVQNVRFQHADLRLSTQTPNPDSQSGLHTWHPQNLNPDLVLETQTQAPRPIASPALGFNSQPRPFRDQTPRPCPQGRSRARDLAPGQVRGGKPEC